MSLGRFLWGAFPLLLHAASIPLPAGIGFEENKGQFPHGILFSARPGAYITPTSLLLPPVTIEWRGGNPAPMVALSDALPYKVNLFSGPDPSKWLTGVRRYAQVRLANVYPGIDLVYSYQSFFTFQFVVAPGASASSIVLSYTGAASVFQFNPGGTLVISLPNGRMGQNTIAWQQTAGERRSVGVRYATRADGYGFDLDAYDSTLPLVIESTLPLSVSGFAGPQFLARSGAMYGFGTEAPPASVDASAPCAGQVYAPSACFDAVVTKWSAAGVPLWLTYLAGSAKEMPLSLDADTTGNAYVGGTTSSADFPVTTNAAQRVYAGGAPSNSYDGLIHGDAFLAKLDSANGMLLYATYLGGPADDTATAVHVDGAGNAYAGGSAGAGLPVTPGALRTTACERPWVSPGDIRPCTLGYLAKLDTSNHLAYLTYLPASPDTFTVDRQGGVYFGGSAAGDLPVTEGAYLSHPIHDRDPFVAKLKPDGSGLVYATYYAAPAAYVPYASFVTTIAVDSKGNAWFNGPCCASQTIGVADLYQHEYIAKLKPDGSGLLYQSTFIGGELAIGADDGVSVFTRFDAPQVVHSAGGIVTSACGEATITKLDSSGTVLLNRPVAQGGAAYTGFLTQDGNLGVPGYSNGPTLDILPIAAGPVPDAACVLNAASLNVPNSIAPGEIVTITGRGIGPAAGSTFQLDAQGRVPAVVGGTRVVFDGIPAPVLYADEGQVNAIAPFTLTPGAAVSITVEAQDRTTSAITAAVTAAEPSLFTLDGSGNGPVLAFNQDGTLNTPQNPAQLGSIVTMFATGLGATNPPSVAGTVAPSIDARPVAQSPLVLSGVALIEQLYAGPSPGSLTSVTQLNVRLPSSVPQPYYPLLAWPVYFGRNAPPAQMPTISLKQ